jgi:hypothetical protein
MPGTSIYHVNVDVLHTIHGILYMVYPWIYHVYPSDWINMVYPWIYHVFYQVYTWYIHGYHTLYIIWCIYMVYTWYIVVYPWIFLAFWNQISRPARAAGLIQCAHACGWSRVFCSTRQRRHHGNCARGKGCHKRLNPTATNVPHLSLVVAVTAAAAAVSLCAFRFPSLSAGNNLNLGEGWGRGCLQDRWPMC